MSEHRASVDWALEPGGDFAKGRYSRAHSVKFAEHTLPGTASHHVIGKKWAVEGAVDPEQMLVGSISTCHMLTFLHVARLKGYVVTGSFSIHWLLATIGLAVLGLGMAVDVYREAKAG